MWNAAFHLGIARGLLSWRPNGYHRPMPKTTPDHHDADLLIKV
jgi:hypothetical protein